MTKSTIKFIKDQLERLKFSGKGKLYYAENFEGLALYVGKKKKTYYAHWSRPIIDKITGKVKMEGMRKRLDGFYTISNSMLTDIYKVSRQRKYYALKKLLEAKLIMVHKRKGKNIQ